ncbi:hypothetical protein Tco_0224041 [Tanacetum coccineum]
MICICKHNDADNLDNNILYLYPFIVLSHDVYPVFVDPEISTQADGAQSSRVPVPLPKDPYEAIRQAYLDGADTESKTCEDPIDTETPESPLTITPPTSLPESTLPTLVPILRRTHVWLCAFHLRCHRASLPVWKRWQLCLSSRSDDDEEDEEIEESLDSDSVSEDAEDEGPTAEDEDPAAGDESLAARDEGPSMDDESHGIDDENHDLDDEGHSIESDRFGLEEEEEAGSGSTPEYERPERVSASRQPTLTTWTDPEDGMVFIDVPAYPQPEPPVQTQPLPEWTSGLLHISPSPSVVPSPISSPMIPLTVPSLVAIPTTTETEGFLTELGAQRYDRDIGELFTRSRAVRDEIFSQRYRFRSLEYEQERVAMTFGAIWRPVLALKLWAGQMDAQRAALWHAISDMQGENYDLRLQLAEERRARLELTEVVDSMRKGQEPRGDV